MAEKSLNPVLIARQPIFDLNLDVYAYELLFRSNQENESGVTTDNGDMATTVVINNAFMEFGLDKIVGNKLAFINLTRTFITGSIPLPFAQEGVVLEILEDIKVDQKIIDSVTQLKSQGYCIALDDFVLSDEWLPLIELASIIKIDLMALSKEELIEHTAILKTKDVKLLAEKIETKEEFELCKTLGFDYFQGYFFSKPTILNNAAIPSNKVSLLRILAELQSPEIDIDKLQLLISQDVSLSFKLLRFLNSAAIAVPRKVESIKQGLVFLGLAAIKKWATLIALADTNLEGIEEVLILALVRAKMAEQLAPKFACDPDSAFVVCLFSLLDTMLSKPLTEIISSIPLADDIKNALVTREGNLGTLLSFTIAYEKDFVITETTLPKNISVDEVNDAYIKATEWVMSVQNQLT